MELALKTLNLLLLIIFIDLLLHQLMRSECLVTFKHYHDMVALCLLIHAEPAYVIFLKQFS